MKNVDAENREREVREMVDLRCRGLSFEALSRRCKTGLSVVRRLYAEAADNNFYGYDPVGKRAVEELLCGELSFAEVALSFGLTSAGLKNYIADRGITERKYPAWKEVCSGSEEIRIVVARDYLYGKRSITSVMDYYGKSYKDCRLWSEKMHVEKNQAESECF